MKEIQNPNSKQGKFALTHQANDPIRQAVVSTDSSNYSIVIVNDNFDNFVRSGDPVTVSTDNSDIVLNLIRFEEGSPTSVFYFEAHPQFRVIEINDVISITPIFEAAASYEMDNVERFIARVIRPDSITVQWKSDHRATKYRIRYREIDTNDWTYVETTDVKYEITGLTERTKYEIQIMKFYGSDYRRYSNYSSKVLVSTIGS